MGRQRTSILRHDACLARPCGPISRCKDHRSTFSLPRRYVVPSSTSSLGALRLIKGFRMTSCGFSLSSPLSAGIGRRKSACCSFGDALMIGFHCLQNFCANKRSFIRSWKRTCSRSSTTSKVRCAAIVEVGRRMVSTVDCDVCVKTSRLFLWCGPDAEASAKSSQLPW